MKNRKKPFLIIMALLLLAAGGVAAWYLTQKDKSVPAVTKTTALVTKPKTKQLVLNYAVGGSVNATKQRAAKLYWQPLTSAKGTLASTMTQNNIIHDSKTYKNEVLLTTLPYTGLGGAKDGEMLWYSNDNGQTYTKLFEGRPYGDKVQDQITDIEFSSDGKTILYSLITYSGPDTVKEINPTSKSTKDLFSDDTGAVFFTGYDSNNNIIYYRLGCYNCDGGPSNILYAYDISNKSTAKVYDETKSTNLYIGDNIFNSDFSKLLKRKSTPVTVGLGTTQPYYVEEFDMQTKTTRKIATVNNIDYPSAGYTEDGSVYYTDGNKLYVLGSNGKTSVVFEGTKPIVNVYHIDNKNIVVRTGDYFGKSTVLDFNLSTKKVSVVLNATDQTTIFGVTQQ